MRYGIRFGIACLLLGAIGMASNNRSEHNSAEWGPYPPVAPFTNSRLPHQWAMVDLYFPLVGPYHFKNDYDLPRGGPH